MKTLYVYPGSFCPPTYGHLSIVKKAASIFPHVLILCSVNEEKQNNWFTPRESCDLWLSYDLPDNVSMATLDEFKNQNPAMSNIVMIRGIRDDRDFEHEKKVLFLNHNDFGIDKYFYLVSDDNLKHISSSAVRELAINFHIKDMHQYVSPMVISKLLEHVIGCRGVFLVVGRPGSGKTTFLKELSNNFSDCGYINTDDFSDILKPIIRDRFPDINLVDLALNNKEELKELIADKWLELLSNRLQDMIGKQYVFVEIAYGLQPDKSVFRFVGGRVVYFGCNDTTECKQRIVDRGTPDLLSFFDVIPGLDESRQICKTNRLSFMSVETNSSLDTLSLLVNDFVSQVKKGEG